MPCTDIFHRVKAMNTHSKGAPYYVGPPVSLGLWYGSGGGYRGHHGYHGHHGGGGGRHR